MRMWLKFTIQKHIEILQLLAIYHQKKQSLQDVVPLDTPFSVHIDICSLCNFKCTFCFQNDKKGMKESGVSWGMMEVDTFKKCVDDLK